MTAPSNLDTYHALVAGLTLDLARAAYESRALNGLLDAELELIEQGLTVGGAAYPTRRNPNVPVAGGRRCTDALALGATVKG